MLGLDPQKIISSSIIAVFLIGVPSASAQDRVPQQKAREVRFTLPSARKTFNVELPTPEKVIQIIEQVREVIIPPICPLPPEEASNCSFNLNDISGPSGNFDISWRCTGSLKPCSIYADDVLVGQVKNSGTAYFNIGAKRTISYQLKDKNDNSCGTGVAHIYTAGKRPPQPVPPPPATTYAQSGYRWFNNADSVTPGSAMAAENTNAETFSGTARLRLLLHVDDVALGASGQSFKAQFASFSGSCAASSYSDIQTGSGNIRFFNNTTPADGDAISTIAGDPTHSGHTVVVQNYQEANNFNNPGAIGTGQDGLWDFSFSENSGAAPQRYCVRVVKSDGTVLDAYSVYPDICFLGEGGC